MKLAFIGGGSAKFVREMVVDLFSYDELQATEIALMDIDLERAERSKRLVEKIITDRRLPATVWATCDQRAALEGADYVIVTIMVGGFESYRSDTDIPVRYGILPAVGDTTGPGGVFRIVRTAPVLRRLVEDIQSVAPHAWILNYANPMSMNMWTIRDCGYTRAVGLCHSIQGAYRRFAQWIGVPPDEVSCTAAGINHINFYLTLRHAGQDLYPKLKTAAGRIVREHPETRVFFELLEYLDYMPAEGPHHQVEYYPWVRKNQVMADEYSVETGWGYRVDFEMNDARTSEVEDQIAGKRPIRFERSSEYGMRIVHALETGEIETFYGNVPNGGLIDNLPANAIVEVPCLADRNGIFPCKMGTIPPQLAAVMTPHIALHEMAVRGALCQDRNLIRQAIQADPLTGAILSLPQIREMVNDFFDANRQYAQGWKD